MSDDEKFEELLGQLDGATPEKEAEIGAELLELAARMAEDRAPTPRDAFRDSFVQAQINHDWPAAERILRQLIALEDSPMMAYRDWDHLSNILEFQGKTDEAYEASLKSNQAARESDIEPLILNALHTEASWAMRRGEEEQALQCIQEGLAQAEAGGPMYTKDVASFLVQKAGLHLKKDELEDAATCLDSAEQILRPYANSGFMTGPLSTLCSWKFATARLLLKRGDIAGARVVNQEALDLGLRIATFPQLEPITQFSIVRRTQERFEQIQTEIERISPAE